MIEPPGAAMLFGGAPVPHRNDHLDNLHVGRDRRICSPTACLHPYSEDGRGAFHLQRRSDQDLKALAADPAFGSF
jgi:hypothetical protein